MFNSIVDQTFFALNAVQISVYLIIGVSAITALIMEDWTN